MAVISVSITKSLEEIISGIPRKITLNSNIPATIFYTLDGSDPTIASNIYIDPIILPTNINSIIIKVLATNGIDSSPIISEKYFTNILNNTRLPHSATNEPVGENLGLLYPFGSSSPQPNSNYFNPGNAGVTVYDPSLPAVPNGFNADNLPDGYSNKPYNLENYSIEYSTTDFLGQYGQGVGNLPANVKVTYPTQAPEESSVNKKTFDPRALVIFQDVDTEDQSDPAIINRQFYTMENLQKSRDGNAFFNTNLDAPPVNGGFLRSYFNPRENTMTYYYFDQIANRWIISKMPYTPNNDQGSMAGMYLSKSKSAGMVYAWRPYSRRILF